MSRTKKTTKTYTIQVIATIEIIAAYEIEASKEEEAKSKAESLLEDDIDSAISYLDGYETYTTESIESEVIEQE